MFERLAGSALFVVALLSAGPSCTGGSVITVPADGSAGNGGGGATNANQNSSGGGAGGSSGGNGTVGTSTGGGTTSGGGIMAGGSTSSGGSGVGLCASSCDKPCISDADCDTSSGQACCDYGAGKVCALASSCPRFCTSDSMCNTAAGEACDLVSLRPGAMRVCEQASAGLQTCQADTDCSGSNTKCCTIYSTPICTAGSECPAKCSNNTQCSTTAGEVCCSTAAGLEPSLGQTSLCLAATSCPRACTSDADCSGTASTPLCCSGICQSTCPKSCSSDLDCTAGNARICCGTIAALPPAPVEFQVASCTGTPVYSSCAQCAGCTCPGCGATPPATCVGTLTPCSSLGEGTCSTQPGCAWN